MDGKPETAGALRVSVTEAKARLSELPARAEAGETVLLTRRGRVVARLAAEGEAGPLPRIGAFEGEATVPDDFDETPEEIAGFFR